MKRFRQLVLAAILVVSFGTFFLLPVVLVSPFILAFIFGGCSTNTIKDIRDLSGFDFKIAWRDCIGLPGDVDLVVYIGKTGRREQALVFAYDPPSAELAEEEYLPSITVSEGGEVSISVRQIDYISVQEYQWKDTPIAYDIGRLRIRKLPLPNRESTP